MARETPLSEPTCGILLLDDAMNGLSLRDPQVIGTLAAAGLCLGGVAIYFAMRKKPSAEEIERERRGYLVQSGRIIDGTLLDITELDASDSGRPAGMQLLLYKYEIGGVVYECSQDVTPLRDLVDFNDCRLGFPCSVRYDHAQAGEQYCGGRDLERLAGHGESGADTASGHEFVPFPDSSADLILCH